MNILAHSLTQNHRKVSFVYDPDGRDSIKGARLIGSWDKDGQHSDQWDQSAVTMKKMPDGTFRADVPLDSSHKGPWSFGIKADGPAGVDKWAVTDKANPSFHLKEDMGEIVYRPTNLKQNGLQRKGSDVNFSYWAPKAQEVSAVVWTPGDDGKTRLPMIQNEQGIWKAQAEGAWADFEGKAYAYEVKDSQGKTALRVDPYARQRMGPQRGVDDLYLHRETGAEVHKFHPQKQKFTRFEVQEYPSLSSVQLSFFDEEGQKLNGSQLKALFGNEGRDLVTKFHGKAKSDHWLESLQDDGSIPMTPQGQAFATSFPAGPGFKGLSYRFEGFDAKGKLLGDLDSNGKLSASEAKALAFNDPYSAKLNGAERSQRFGLVEESNFDWKNDDVPRIAENPNDQVIYQLHPGSIFGSAKNVDRSSFKDITERLDYFKDLGVNTLELMPVNSFEGSRDWGYIGSHNMAMSENYGFVDDEGQWVQGDDALKMFVDAAHSKGLKVFNDVVYNHFGGDYNNVWNVGGEENPWFEWDADPAQPGESTKSTPWGALPAYNKKPVTDFITNHALNQLDEFHFDGLRFDFTHPIHAQGEHGGGTPGWEMLQKINRTIDFFHPKAFIAAEEFPNHGSIVTSPAEGGAGFDAMWNTEFQHRLVHDHGNPSVLQEAANGHHTRVDKLMNQLLYQPGFKGGSTSVTVVSNHDEVGNADRILNVANHHRDPSTAGPWEKSVTRTSTAIGLLSPGMPLFFQGDESLATNKFSWGTPATWDLDWNWQNQPESDRFKHHSFTKAVLALKTGHDAFDADSEAHRVYTHEVDSVMAFSRKRGEQEFLVVSSFNKNDLAGYGMPVSGEWKPVLSSDSPEFGGRGAFESRDLGPGGSVDLAAGATLVFERVG